jgi:hypothetical protein
MGNHAAPAVPMRCIPAPCKNICFSLELRRAGIKFAIASPFRRGGTKRQTMKMTLSTYAVADLLLADNNANWSRAGALACHLEEIESETGGEMEFDAVAIRCDYSEYKDLGTWAEDYFAGDEQAGAAAVGLELDMDGKRWIQTEEEALDLVRDYIRDRGQLIEFAGGVIVSSF